MEIRDAVLSKQHLIKKSEVREVPMCEHFGICGGCKWQNLPYAEQLKAKVFDVGVGGVIINIPTQVTGYVPGVITALGAALHSAIGG